MSEPRSAYPPLVMVEWVDATNIPTWVELAEIAEWAVDGGFVCRNVGYLVHEDADCIVLAARVALLAEPPQVGLFERLPKRIITDRWTLQTEGRPPRTLADDVAAGLHDEPHP